jgi:ligand-binding sensor domain-containing protein
LNYTWGGAIPALVKEGNLIWVGTTGGLVAIDKVSGATTFYNKCNSGLPDNNIHCIAIDAMGNKWIGTELGLAKFDGSNWRVFNTSNSQIPGDYICSIAIDKADNLWIEISRIDEYNHYWGCMAKFDGQYWTVYNSSNTGYPNKNGGLIVIDLLGNKWIHSDYNPTTLVKFKDSDWITFNLDLPQNDIRSMAFDNSNTLWILTVDGNLVKYDGTDWIIYNTSNSGLPSNYVSTITIDASGNKWILSGGKIIKYNGNEWIVHHPRCSDIYSVKSHLI